MTQETATGSRLHGVLSTLAISLGFWLLVGLIDSTWFYFTALQQAAVVDGTKMIKETQPWPAIFMFNLPYWLVAAGLTPPVVWLTRRFGFRGRWPWRAIAIHSLCVLPFAIVHVALFRLVKLAPSGWPAISKKLPLMVRGELSVTLDKEILFYVFIVGAVSAFDYYRRYREQERAAAVLELEQARLQASLSEARLGALQMQLQPHFLFNALHAISTLILRGDTKAANQMLLHLSSFLRMTLDSRDAPVVPLPVELEFLEAYLRIQRVRFGDRLQVVMEIEDAARDAEVPNLILQPLVENAIHHGIGSDPGQGTITIRARRSDSQLVLSVADTGPGPRDPAGLAEGIGLSNIRARLEQLHPRAHRFTLERGPAGGTLASIEIPFRESRRN